MTAQLRDGRAAQRAEGLAAAARVCRDALLALAEDLHADAVADVVEEPSPAAVAVELEHPAGGVHVGQVVITRCVVQRLGRTGHGIVLGRDALGALACAVCDSAEAAEVDALVAGALEHERRAADEHAALVARTYVGAS